MLPALFALCVLAECSNDPDVLGDERLAWDAVELATSYEVCSNSGACVTTSAPELLLPGTSLADRMGLVRVRACDAHNQLEAPACGDWSEPVEFLPIADLRHVNCRDRGPVDGWGCDTCELPTQGWRRLPHLPLCPEGLP